MDPITFGSDECLETSADALEGSHEPKSGALVSERSENICYLNSFRQDFRDISDPG